MIVFVFVLFRKPYAPSVLEIFKYRVPVSCH